MSNRSDIVNSMHSLFKADTGLTAIIPAGNMTNRMVFWDEINDYPYLCITAGNEEREYQPGNFTWGFLNIKVRVYVESEDSEAALDALLSEVERIVNENNNLSYGTGKNTEIMSLTAISTDEGVLSPIGVGELTIVIQYEVI